MDIVAVDQRRQPIFKARQRQALGGINPWRAQDGHHNAITCSPGAQALLRRDPAGGARALRIQASCFVDDLSAAVAIDPGGTDVNKVAW